MGEVVFLSIVGLLGIGMLVMTGSFPTSLIDKSGGPALFPRIVIILLLVFLIARIVTIIRSEEEKKKEFRFLEIFKGSRLFFLIVFILFILTIEKIGFIISGSVFAIVMMFYLYRKQYGENMSKKRMAVTAVIATVSVVVIYILFTRYFNVLLPAGIIHL